MLREEKNCFGPFVMREKITGHYWGHFWHQIVIVVCVACTIKSKQSDLMSKDIEYAKQCLEERFDVLASHTKV